jgi:hypothetical protein
MLCTAYNSGHAATLRSAQIQPDSWTSDTLETLCKIARMIK